MIGIFNLKTSMHNTQTAYLTVRQNGTRGNPWEFRVQHYPHHIDKGIDIQSGPNMKETNGLQKNRIF